MLFSQFWKLVSAIFHFSQLIALKQLRKMRFIYLKSYFGYWDIQFFVFLSFPLFFLVDHCFSGWSKINLKFYDVFNCLNKNFITHFVWYLEKEKMYVIETLSIEWVYKKIQNIFMEKLCRKCASKASPRPLLNFVKQLKTVNAGKKLF